MDMDEYTCMVCGYHGSFETGLKEIRCGGCNKTICLLPAKQVSPSTRSKFAARADTTMRQFTVKDLRKAIKDMPDDLPVFFRRIAPICGTIEEAGAVNRDTFVAFGIVSDCVIIEPFPDNDGG